MAVVYICYIFSCGKNLFFFLLSQKANLWDSNLKLLMGNYYIPYSMHNNRVPGPASTAVNNGPFQSHLKYTANSPE